MSAPPGQRLLAVNPWWYMGSVLATIAVLAGLSVLWRPFHDRFVGPYLWDPILYDQGFNPVNTLAFVLFVAAAILWFAGLFRHYGVHYDMTVEAAVLAWLAWGASIRVLEDADMHAPFAGRLAAAGLPPQTSCAPGLTGHWLSDCAGALFITPIVWIWPALLMFLAARASLASQRFDQRGTVPGPAAGLVHYAGSHGVLLVAYTALAAADPAWLRSTAPVWLWGLASGAALAFVAWRRRRDGHVRWSWGLLGFCFPLLASSGHAVWRWFVGDGAWQAGPSAHPVALLLFLAGPPLVALAFVWHARTLAAAPGKGRPAALLALGAVVLVEAFAVFFGMVAFIQGSLLWLAAPATVAAGHVAMRAVAQRWGAPPGAAAMAGVVPALMVWGQSADALVTAVGIDVYGAGEKHLLPRTMIEAVSAADLAAPWGAYPTALVLVPYKLVVTLLAAWYFETRTRPWLSSRPDLYLLIALAVLHVGIAPAMRNALRLAMGV